MRRIGVVLLVGMLLAASAGAALKEGELNPDMTNPGSVEFPRWFKQSFLNVQEDVAEAAAQKKRVLLFFYQDGCPYCKKLVQMNFTQHDIVEKTQKTLDLIAINMWGDREVTWVDGSVMIEKEFAAKMRVMFTPTLLFLDETGKVALRLNGYYEPVKFAAVLDYVAGHREAEESFGQYYNRLAPAPASGELNRQAFFLPPPHDLGRVKAPGKKPLVVVFEQRQCPSCDELHKDVLTRKETLEQVARFDAVQLDRWSGESVVTTEGKRMTAADWAGKLDIKYVPAMVFFDEQGKEVFRAEAYLKSFHVQSVMDYVASKAYLTQPSFQRYIEGRADALRAKGVTINIME